MTGYAHIRIDKERYVLITHVGCGRVKLTYDGGPAISMWESTARYPWVYKFDGFDAFERSGYMFLAHAMLREFDRQRRGPMRVIPDNARDVDTAAVESAGENADSTVEDTDPATPDTKLDWPTFYWKGGQICPEEIASKKEAVDADAEATVPLKQECTAGKTRKGGNDVHQ
jgi:hypothetical protein